MLESPNEQFDADIARNLRFSTMVTPLQQQNAKARLLLCAAEQRVLPPLESVVQRATSRAALRDHIHTIGQHMLRLLNLLLLDSSIYERARKPPRLYQYYNAHGRYVFTIIRMSA